MSVDGERHVAESQTRVAPALEVELRAAHPSAEELVELLA
jgi:hypothetical protein